MPGETPERSALERLQNLGTPGRPAAASPAAGGTPHRGIAGALVLAGLAWKFKALFAGLKLASFATTASTMLLMVWTYSFFYGWPFAAGFVVLILVHELGHGAAAWAVGLRVGAPVFIPFFGAFIALRERPRSTFQDFVVGAGGPIAGSAGGAACVAASFLLPETAGAGLLRALGFFTLILNLFNLIPVWQLDGARMVTPIRNRAGLAGFAVLGAVLVGIASSGAALNPIALFVVALGAFRYASRGWRERNRVEPASALERLSAMTASARAVPDDGVSPSQRRLAWAVYFGLSAALMAGVHALPQWLPSVGH